MPALLDRIVTTVRTQVQGRPVPTIHSAFEAAGIMVMSEEVRELLKKEGAERVYRQMFPGEVVPEFLDIQALGWGWHCGWYNLLTKTFEGRNNTFGTLTQMSADPNFANLAEKLDEELAKVPGIDYSFGVESLYSDPLGYVEIAPAGSPDKKKYFFYAWDGTVNGRCTTWPPSCG